MTNLISAYSNTGNAPPVFGGTTRIAGLDVPNYIRAPSLKYHLKWYLQGKYTRGRSFTPPWGSVVIAQPLQIQHTTQIGVGILPVYTPANTAGTDSFVATPGTLEVISIYNLSNTPLTVQVTPINICEQGYLHPYNQLIPAGVSTPTVIGPFDRHYFNSQNVVKWSYSANINNVFVAVLAP